MLPDDSEKDADEILDSIENLESKLLELFHACMEQSNTYWEEQYQSGWYVDVDRVVSAVDVADIRNLTGLPLLHPDQQWRKEPYPWIGADPAPLVS